MSGPTGEGCGRAGEGCGRAGEKRGHGARPEVDDGVGPPRAPAGGGVGVGAAELGERPADGEVAGQPDVGVGEAAHGDQRGGPRPDAGDGEQPAAGLVAVGARVEHQRVARQRLGERVDGATPGAGQPHRGEVGVDQRLGAGEGVGQRADRLGQRRPGGGQQPRGERAGAGHRHLLAEDRAHRRLRRVRRRRHPAAGRAGDQRRERGIGAQHLVDGGGIGVQVEHPAGAGHRGGEVAQRGQAQARDHGRAAVRRGLDLHDGRTVREVQDPGERRAVPLLEAGYRVGAEELQHLGGLVRRARRQPQGEPAGPGRAAAGRSAQRRGGRGVDVLHRLVELADAGEPGGEGDVGHRQVGGLDQQPCGVRALGAGQRQGTDAEFGDEVPVQLPLRVPEPRRPAPARRSARPRRPRSAAWRGPRRRPARPTPASRAPRRAGSGGRRGSRRPGRRRPWRRRRRCGPAACGPGRTAGSRSRSCGRR